LIGILEVVLAAKERRKEKGAFKKKRKEWWEGKGEREGRIEKN